MHRPRWARALLACALAGCLTTGCVGPQATDGTTRTAAWYDRVRGWTGATPQAPAADGLYLQTTLVDRPAPDPFLTTDLWAAGSTVNPLSAEQSALLELNGIRVRVTGGIPPAKLLTMLWSNDAVSPTARTVTAGVPKVVPVNGPVDALRFAARRDLKADPVPTELADVECGMAVTARPADNGRVTLRCEPQIQHGDRQQWLKPTADGSGFDRQEQKPLDTFPTLGFDVTLAPGEYLVVGPSAEPGGTLGQAYFYPAAGDRVRQRVLVVRAAKATDGAVTRPGASRSTAAAAAQTSGRLTARGTSR